MSPTHEKHGTCVCTRGCISSFFFLFLQFDTTIEAFWAFFLFTVRLCRTHLSRHRASMEVCFIYIHTLGIYISTHIYIYT